MNQKLNIIKAIKTYQVPGDIGDFNPKDYKTQEGASGWDDHCPGTFLMPTPGLIFLGMPHGFDRLGCFKEMKLMIFKDFEQYKSFYSNEKFNIPVWKYLDEHNNTLIRGLMPRTNYPFLCVILGNHISKINCLEITKEDVNSMD